MDTEIERNQKAQEDDPTVAVQDQEQSRSDYSIGLGKLLSGVRASTNGETIGGPLAAFVLRGNLIFVKGRPISRFSNGHPLQETSGHRTRTVINWPKYLAKRIPDLNDLGDDSFLLPEEREEKRSQYAKSFLTMLVPFRDISDLVMEGESKWEA